MPRLYRPTARPTSSPRRNFRTSITPPTSHHHRPQAPLPPGAGPRLDTENVPRLVEISSHQEALPGNDTHPEPDARPHWLPEPVACPGTPTPSPFPPRSRAKPDLEESSVAGSRSTQAAPGRCSRRQVPSLATIPLTGPGTPSPPPPPVGVSIIVLFPVRATILLGGGCLYFGGRCGCGVSALYASVPGTVVGVGGCA